MAASAAFLVHSWKKACGKAVSFTLAVEWEPASPSSEG